MPIFLFDFIMYHGKGFNSSLCSDNNFLVQAVDLKSSNILSPYNIEVIDYILYKLISQNHLNLRFIPDTDVFISGLRRILPRYSDRDQKCLEICLQHA